MLKTLNQYKGPIGAVWSLIGIGLLLCGDQTCGRAGLYFTAAGTVLTAMGVTDSDSQAKQKALAAKLGPLVPAIQAALPAAEEIASIISKEVRDAFAQSPPQAGGRRASDPPAPPPPTTTTSPSTLVKTV